MVLKLTFKLGDAFIRPGRVDARFELKECNREQIEVMVRSFINKSYELFVSTKDETLDNTDETKKWDDIRADNAGINKKIAALAAKLTDPSGESIFKPCEIQSYLLKHINNLDDLFGKYDELLQTRQPTATVTLSDEKKNK